MSLERRIWHVGTFISAILLIVSFRIVYWQLVRGNDLSPVAIDVVAAGEEYAEIRQPDDEAVDEEVTDVLTGRSPLRIEELPQPVIQRTSDLLASITRGSIYDRSGRLLAADRAGAEGERVRVYTEPSLAHVIGYVSGIRAGVAGVERTYNPTLLGLNRPDTQLNQLIHQPIIGTDLILTIDSRTQRAAVDGLGNRAGAVVALDGQTGAVLAMVSTPYFDPNQVLDPAYTTSLIENCGSEPRCQAPFLNRATQALYSPGSTWKTVTLIAALDSGQVEPDTVFDFGRARNGPNGPYYVYEVDGGVIPDPNHRESRLNLEQSFAKSANAAFARMGDEMPPDTFIQYAERLGFGAPGHDTFSFPIPLAASQLANNVENIRTNNLLRAATAIGQGELLATPLNMAMVALAVINEGDIPVPYLVDSLQAPGANPRSAPRGGVIRNVMRPETARIVRDMMIYTVREGSGRQAIVDNATAGGKTGTAQLGGNQEPHAWFIGFAEAGERSVAIAVVVENGGSGFQAAAPIFAQVARAALFQQGEEVEEIVPLPPPLPDPSEIQAAELEAAPSESEQPPAAEQRQVTNIARPPDMTFAEARIGPRLPGAGACRPESLENAEPVVGTGQFGWPSPYHDQAGGGDVFKPRHPGLDLSAVAGSPVYATDAGRVIFAGWSEAGYGNAVVIDHGNGYRSLYAHLSQVSTACGAAVQVGELIGQSGETGEVYGPHLHFEIRVEEGFVDPLTLLPPP